MNQLPSPVVQPVESAPGPSALALIAAMFHSPTRAFEALGVRPRWWLALAILVAAGVAVHMVVIRHLDMAGTLREGMEARARGRELSQAELQHAAEQAQKFAPVGVVVGAVAAPVVYLLVSGVYFLGLKLAGSEVEYPAVFATTLHGMLPPAVIKGGITALVVAQKGAMTATELARAVKSNVGSFLPPEAPAALRNAAEVLDVFNLWAWLLLAVGFAIVGRIPRARAASVVAVVWVGWAGIRALLGALL